MPPMPPAPGAPPPPAAAAFSSLISAMRASVVSIRPAMEAAFCSARRVTFAGSMTPILTMSPYSPVSALKPKFSSFESGVECDLAGRLFESTLHDACANGFVIVQLELLDCGDATEQSGTAACNDAFFDSRASGVHCVFDTRLLFLQFGLGRRRNARHSRGCRRR